MRSAVFAFALFAASASAQEAPQEAAPAEGAAPAEDAAPDEASPIEAAPEAPAPQEEEAALRTRSADLAREAGRLEDALRDYRLAFDLSPTPERLLAVVAMLEALRRDEELVEAYATFLERYPEHPRTAELEARRTVAASAAVAVPEPEADAEAEVDDAIVATDPEAADEGGGSIFDETWFWAVVGGVVVVGLFAVLFATSSQGVQDPLPGTDGIVVTTLRESF